VAIHCTVIGNSLALFNQPPMPIKCAGNTARVYNFDVPRLTIPA
jgi:hypothetical protein